MSRSMILEPEASTCDIPFTSLLAVPLSAGLGSAPPPFAVDPEEVEADVLLAAREARFC